MRRIPRLTLSPRDSDAAFLERNARGECVLFDAVSEFRVRVAQVGRRRQALAMRVALGASRKGISGFSSFGLVA